MKAHADRHHAGALRRRAADVVERLLIGGEERHASTVTRCLHADLATPRGLASRTAIIRERLPVSANAGTSRPGNESPFGYQMARRASSETVRTPFARVPPDSVLGFGDAMGSSVTCLWDAIRHSPNAATSARMAR
jgi:hypothetical protein